jgi:cytochrome oxidase Cu insertion factor (SCO1/SenC/PrrC family)
MWTLVLVAGGIVFYLSSQRREAPPSDVPAGMVLVDVPWKHLPDVDRFKLIDQTGNTFDSADLVGTPYVVSFFFADCPTICRELNSELERVNRALKDTDIRFLTISVDPEKDTPEVLKPYAEGFGATPDRWAFLTGQPYQVKEVGEHMFNVVVDRDTHTDNILLVDKWGRYRDRFKWDQPYDMQRFVKVAKEVAAETEPPLDQSFQTRNVLAGFEPKDLANVPWIREFHLTERSGKKFFSRDLTGQVWIANFFFSTCPGICKQQNQYLRDLQNRLGDQCPTVVSISTKPTDDTPEKLRAFATELGADDKDWLFCTGDPHLIERIGAEFFQAAADGGHHSSLLYIVDRWGDVRGSFDWEDPKQEIEMLDLIKQLESETRPLRPVDVQKEQPDDGLGDES